jgi:hypothetical protein
MNWVLLLLVSQVFSNGQPDATVTSIRFNGQEACQSAGAEMTELAKQHKQSVSFVCVHDQEPPK